MTYRTVLTLWFVYLMVAEGTLQVDLCSQNLTRIPNTTVIPPTVTILILNKNYIERIFEDDLRPFTKLNKLYMNKVGIKVIENGAFDYNGELEYLEIRDNYHTLEHLPISFGPSRLYLTHIHLWASLHNGVNFDFRELVVLKWLNIGYWLKGSLDPAKLPPSLEHLTLNMNPLYNLPNLVPHTPNLTELRAANIRISHVSDDVIIGLTKLNILDLMFNQLRTLPDLYHLPLVNLYLSGNPLTCNQSLCWIRMWNYKRSPTLSVDDAVCEEPLALKGSPLTQVNPVDLGCFEGETKKIQWSIFAPDHFLHNTIRISWMKSFVFWLRFDWSSFLMVQLTISQLWLR